MKKTSPARLFFPVILLSFLTSISIYSAEKPVKKDLSYLTKITRLGQQKSGILSFQDMETTFSSGIFTKNNKALSLPPERKLIGSINVFVIYKNGKLYLIDAGMGHPGGKTAFLLEKLDVKKEKVHAVLLTHVHPDHIGGLVTGDNKAVFPGAIIYLSKNEYDAVSSPKSPMYHAFARVKNAYGNRITPFTAGDKVENIFQSRFAPGHTPGHTLYQYGKILFIGDLLHSAQYQFDDPEICASFDMNKKLAIKYRKKFLSYASENDLLIAGAHIPFPGTGKVQKKENNKGYSFSSCKE
ncbi:MAG: MBL fold metallo-hydrolase [Lentisphaeria bacterium]|nr:MBL fold metallo-hydrolase [Lentisphaeria bacterium]